MTGAAPALTPETVIDYVHAFCGRLKGELGPFRLVHAGSGPTLLRTIGGDMRPRVTAAADGFALSGYMIYAGDIYAIEMRITPDGKVSMTRSEPVGTVRFDSP